MLKLHEITENINKTPYKGKILEHEDLSQRTTMKTGGTAALFLVPQDKKSFFIAIACLRSLGIPFFILGGGSNVIPPDGELEAVVVSTESLDKIEILEADGKQMLVRCGAGTKTCDLVDFCTDNGLSGLESFAGLPGTAGGAAYMNARCYGKEVSDVLFSAEYFDLEDIQKITDFSDNFIERHLKMYHNIQKGGDWAYKKSPFMRSHGFLVELTFKLAGADKEQKESIASECRRYVDDRNAKGHFKAPSAGSVFKNDRSFGQPSGRLIDEAGLKGRQIGGAQIAPWHGNIIINQGKATSSDIKALVQLVQDEILGRTGFRLEPEIIFIEQNLQ